MSEVNITLRISCMFTNEQHRDTIVETARDGAEHTLRNMLMILPSGGRIRPYITMTVEELGEEDRVSDIVKEVQQKMAEQPVFEDPFA